MAGNPGGRLVEPLWTCQKPYIWSRLEGLWALSGDWSWQEVRGRAESCSGLSCRWLAQNGEWTFPIITGPLFVLTFFSLVSLNFSDPGILHQGETWAPWRRR